MDNEKWHLINIKHKLSSLLNDDRITTEDYCELSDMIESISNEKEHHDIRTISFNNGYKLGYNDGCRYK